MDGYYDSLGFMCGGVVLLGLSVTPYVLQEQPSAALLPKGQKAAYPTVWRVLYPQDTVDQLVTYKNPWVTSTTLT